MAEAERRAATAGEAAAGGVGSGPHGFDRDLDLRAILAFGAGLTLVLGAVLAAVWLLVGLFRAESAARDPGPSPLPEASQKHLPPEPRLQASETADMERLRAEEDAILGSYGWVDRAAGVGRIPVGRAIEILAATGLKPEPEASAPQAKPPRRRRRRP